VILFDRQTISAWHRFLPIPVQATIGSCGSDLHAIPAVACGSAVNELAVNVGGRAIRAWQ
jgi:hypothetical protein